MTQKSQEPDTQLTDEIQAKIIQALSLGAHYEDACGFAGLPYSIFLEWMEQGKSEKSGPFYDLFNAVKKAESSAIVGSLAKIEKAGNGGDWQAIAWKLERRHPGEWGRKKEVKAKKNKGCKVRF